MYGKSLACATDHDLSSATLLIESPEILRVREEIENKETPKTATSQPSEIKIKFVIISFVCLLCDIIYFAIDFNKMIID